MRLLPRYSLRFVWLALTSLLIVLGVVVNYAQRYQAHEQIAQKLQNLDYEVEEKTSTFLGFTIGKTLVGLEGPAFNHGDEDLTLLRALPRPSELLRFAHRRSIRNQEQLRLLLQAIEQYTNLEELYLDDMIFTEEQFATLGKLKNLRVLDLGYCNVPPRGLAVLERLPQLEQLLLKEAKFPPAELLQPALPQLRVVDLSRTPLTELPLTKSGWGKYPRLETLIIGRTALDKITCEAGALLNLQHLDLAFQGKCAIDWAGLPAAAPNLTSVALHVSQFTPESAAALRQLPKLRHVHLNTDRFRRDEDESPLTGQTESPDLYDFDIFVFTADQTTLEQDLRRDRPQLLFCQQYSDFYDLIMPQTLVRNPGHVWVSANWRPVSPGGGYNTAPLPPVPPNQWVSNPSLFTTPARPVDPFPVMPSFREPLPTPPQTPGNDPIAPFTNPFTRAKNENWTLNGPGSQPTATEAATPNNNLNTPFANPLGLPDLGLSPVGVPAVKPPVQTFVAPPAVPEK